jgi:hypothetical protein
MSHKTLILIIKINTMLPKLFVVLFLAVGISSYATSSNEPVGLQKMYKQYAGKWYRTFTFIQTTETYRNDSVRGKQTWYEASIFPDRFRIDFGAPDSGNAVLFNKDSSYSFRRGKLRAVKKDANDLTFLLGGMYFYPYETVTGKMKELGYDLDKSFETNWKGKPVYVVGANTDGEKVNQLWIDKEKLCVVRFIKYENGKKEEGILEDHIKAGNGWTETKVSFYIDDKLLQKEYYHDFKADAVLDEKLFDPKQFGSWHWVK